MLRCLCCRVWRANWFSGLSTTVSHMKISATIKNGHNENVILVETDAAAKSISIPPKATGYGSSVNGGELLLLALATCFCNDIYREASKRNMAVKGVEVVSTGEFGAEGEPGSNFTYQVATSADASPAEIQKLIQHTDRVAEIHNTLRKGLGISLNS